MPTSDRLLNDAATGLASSAEFTENMQDIEDVILDMLGGAVVSGAIPTVVAGLTLRIPASVYDIGVKRSKSQEDISLTNNATNRIFAVTDPDDDEGISYVIKTDTTVPSRSALRAIAVTSGGSITSITETPGNKKVRVELGLHTITLDQYINTNLPVNSDLLLKWDFSAKGSFPLQDYQVVIDPDDIDQLPTSTLVFVLPVRNPDHFYLYIQNMSDAVAGGYGGANQIRLTPKLVGRGYSLVSETGVDTVTATAVNFETTGSHVLATTAGLGPEHTVSGLTDRQILIATGASSARFESIAVETPAASKIPLADVNNKINIGWLPGVRGPFYGQVSVASSLYHVAGMQTAAQFVTPTTYTIDQLYALPILKGRGGVLDRIQCVATAIGAAGSVVRLGIYDSTSDDDFYPNNLVVDSGAIATDVGTGAKEATINASLLPNKLYWAVILIGVASPTLRSVSINELAPILGCNSGLFNQQWGYTVAFSYAALPSTFPVGATTASSTPVPAIGMRYSS